MAPAQAPEPTGPQEHDICFKDNTAYYGNNLNNPQTTRTQNTIECQRLCQDWNGGGGRYNLWSWDKEFGRCYIKSSMDGE